MARMKWVVDASAAAKWLAPEAESAQAEALLEHDLFVPDLVFPEVANILSKKQSRGEIDEAVAVAAARWLQHLPWRVVPSATLMPAALALSVRLRHPACDCFYLALAVAQDSAVVTADRRLFERCRQADAPDLHARVSWLAAMPA